MHYIKPEPLLVQHVKYEPDLTRDARDMGYVEKQVVFRTPCRSKVGIDLGLDLDQL